MLTFSSVVLRHGVSDEREGIVGLIGETVDGLRTLIADHIKLARVELATDLKSYTRSVAALAVAGLVLALGYAFAWIAAALALARLWGAPLAFAAVAGLHLLIGGIAVSVEMARLKRTQLMRETVVEARSSVDALVQPLQGRTT